MNKKFKDLDRLQANFRKEYHFGKLEDKDVKHTPWGQFESWFEDALERQIERINVVTLATASKKGKPAARTMLIKGFDEKGFIFYSNYESEKAQEISSNPHAVLLFYWPQVERQIRIDGKVSKLSKEDSYRYFSLRPRFSRIAAWSSKQSRKIASRNALDAEVEANAQKFESGEIPLPPFWGGYRVQPVRFEFWQGRENRLNDRFVFALNSKTGKWTRSRLYP